MNCKRIMLENNKILLGLIISEDDHFLNVKTKNNFYSLNKSRIQAISETREEFDGDKDGKNKIK